MSYLAEQHSNRRQLGKQSSRENSWDNGLSHSAEDTWQPPGCHLYTLPGVTMVLAYDCLNV